MSPDALLIEMSRELGIEKSHIESENEWKQRIILSACSAWVLESVRSTAVSLSVTQMKRKLQDKVLAYLELFHPTIATLKAEDSLKNIVDYIYDIHMTVGSLYHKAYYICPAKEQVNTCYGVKLYRSPTYPLKLFFSGMGTYTSQDITETSESPESLYANYLLPSEKPNEVLNQLVKARKWREQTGSSSIEFLNLFRKHGEGYYTKKPIDSDELILLREAVEYGNRYILRHGSLQYNMQEWEQEEYIYEYVALALMQKYQELYAQVLIDSNLVKIKLGYSLPKPEESFLRLYAWPYSLSDLNNHWDFGMMPAIYPVMKGRLSHLGFIIREEAT